MINVNSMKKITVKRPWGKFEQFCLNEKCTVKILTIKSGEELSLQYHKKREEFWKVVVGKAEIIIGKKVKNAREGDEFVIPKKTKHQAKTGKETVKILEICFGKFDEGDIVRLEDKYHRT